MLKVNVGLSRKVSRDYNSTGFSLNLEGEVLAPLDDPERVIGKIQELYDLAEETLNQQVERYESESAIASRDEVPANRATRVSVPTTARNSRIPDQHSTSRTTGNGQAQQSHAGAANGNNGEFTPASNKQISFITNLAKRQGLTTPQLLKRVAEIVGREVDLYDLSKKEAGIVLDDLTAESTAATSRRR